MYISNRYHIIFEKSKREGSKVLYWYTETKVVTKDIILKPKAILHYGASPSKPCNIHCKEIPTKLSCLRWKGIRKKGLGFMARWRPGESFLGQKGSKLWSREPRPLTPSHIRTPGRHFGFTPYVNTLLALLKTWFRVSVSSMMFKLNGFI